MITYKKRIEQLDKKIDACRVKLTEIELQYGQRAKYENKEMEIEELMYLKEWYSKKIRDDEERTKYRLCRIRRCKNYIHGTCFICRLPNDNKCDFLEVSE